MSLNLKTKKENWTGEEIGVLVEEQNQLSIICTTHGERRLISIRR